MNSNIDSPSKYQAIYDKYSNKNFKVREIEHGDYNKGTFSAYLDFRIL